MSEQMDPIEKEARVAIENLWADLEAKAPIVERLRKHFGSTPVALRTPEMQVMANVLGLAWAEIQFRQVNRDEAHYCKTHGVTVEEFRKGS